MRRTAVMAVTIVACLCVPAASLGATRIARPRSISSQSTIAPPVSPTTPAGQPSATPASAGWITLHDQRVDRAAMRAYAAYLRALVIQMPLARHAEHAFVAQTRQTCKGVLAPIAQASSSASGWSAALTDLGEEIGDDATIAFNRAMDGPFTRLTLALGRLHWAGADNGDEVRRFLSAEAALLALSPSNLCADSWSLASASAGQTMTAAPGTLQLLSSYQAAATALNLHLGLFIKQLGTFETAADAGLAARINTLAKRVETLSSTTTAEGTTALKVALAIIPPPARTRARARAAVR